MLVLALDDDNHVIHVDDSERSKDYHCPDCSGTVRCRKGEINAHHFYHLNNDCQSNGESVVHKYFKQKFAELKTIELDGITYNVTHSEIEKSITSNLRVDVLLILNGWKPIALEICYKHKKDDEHINMYRELGLEAYEIYVDMNEEQTDFIVVDYKTIYSAKEYVDVLNEQHRQELLDMEQEHEQIMLELRKDHEKEFERKTQELRDDKNKLQHILDCLEKDAEYFIGMSLREMFTRVENKHGQAILVSLHYAMTNKFGDEVDNIVLTKIVEEEERYIGFIITGYDANKKEIGKIEGQCRKTEYSILKDYLIREWNMVERTEETKRRFGRRARGRRVKTIY